MRLMLFHPSSSGHAVCHCPKCKTGFADIVSDDDCDECKALPAGSVSMDCPVCGMPLHVSRIIPEPVYKISALRV